MKHKLSWSISGPRLAMALWLGAVLALGVGGAAGWAAASDEPVASEPAAPVTEAAVPALSPTNPAALQIVFVCFDANENPVGLPKSTLAACQAACPAEGSCARCTFRNNAVECP